MSGPDTWVTPRSQHRASRPIAPRGLPVFLVTIENLAAGFARYAEIPARIVMASHFGTRATSRRRSSVAETPSSLGIHTFRRKKSEKCHPCVRFEMPSPVSWAAQPSSTRLFRT
jgi:hypothetical protein